SDTTKGLMRLQMTDPIRFSGVIIRWNGRGEGGSKVLSCKMALLEHLLIERRMASSCNQRLVVEIIVRLRFLFLIRRELG
ncbi:hypothetical protein PMAYCL1PPCAC_27191, partial [Pristionchus mayeri]